jgi:hypothetical protein
LVASTCRVETLAEHEPTSFAEPYLFLELQGAHCGDGLKVVVKARYTHAQFLGYVLDPKRLVEVFAELFHCPRDAMSLSSLERNLTEPVALLTHQEPVDDFPCNESDEHVTDSID